MVKHVCRVAVVAGAMFCSFTTWAASKDWAGPISGTAAWDTAEYWNPEGKPGMDDSVTFDLGQGNDLSITGSTNFRRITLKSGTLTFASGYSHHHRNHTEFTVSNEAVLVYNSLQHYNGTKAGAYVAYKFGEGEMRVTHIPQQNGYDPFANFIVEGGVLNVNGDVRVAKWTVKDGATFVLGCDFGADPAVVTLDGPTARVLQDGLSRTTCRLSGITGSGLIECAPGAAFAFTLAAGPLTFSGTTADARLDFTNATGVAASDFTYTIQSASALEHAVVSDSCALRFADGIDTFKIGGLRADPSGKWATRIAAKNVLGDPIMIETAADVSGSGIDLVGGMWKGTITNSANSGTLTVEGTNVFADGTILMNRQLTFAEDAVFIQQGGTAACAEELNQLDTITSRRLPLGVHIADSTHSGAYWLTGGEAAVYLSSGLPHLLGSTGGVLTFQKPTNGASGFDPAHPSEVRLDGGEIDISLRKGTVQTSASSPFDLGTASTVAGSALTVGAKGGVMAAIDTPCNTIGARDVGYKSGRGAINLHLPITKAADASAAGPLEFCGWTCFNHFGGISTGGELLFRDGQHYVKGFTAFEAADGALFGTASLWLRGVLLGFDKSDATETTAPLRLATGADSTLTYEGAVALVLKGLDTAVAHEAVLGQPVRAGRGSALFIANYSADGTSDTATGAKLAAGATVTTNADGVVLDPIYLSGNHIYRTPRPLKYDAERGFVTLPDSECTENGFVEGKFTRLTADTENAYGKKALGLLLDNTRLMMNSAGTLFLGDGVHPALVSVFRHNNPFPGGCTLDFGGSEGVFSSVWSQGNAGHAIWAHLRGTNGISFVVPPQEDTTAGWFSLKCANDYEGGTTVAGAVVQAAVAGCFGSGPVRIHGGEYAGGAVWLAAADAVWANDFDISGMGARIDSSCTNPFGALVFDAPTTITGDVTLRERAYVDVNADADAVISGTVSGDRLVAYRFAAGGLGTLELAGANTYTGGTEIVQQSVAIRQATGFGTGAVRVDKGALVFRNDAAITVANSISGEGVIRIEGAGAVSFADIGGFAVSEFQVGPGEHAFAEDFAFRPLVGTGTTKRARSVLVLKAGGIYTLGQDDLDGIFEIVLEAGARLDLGGGTLTVFRFTGDRADVNGTIVETNPKQGLLLLFR